MTDKRLLLRNQDHPSSELQLLGASANYAVEVNDDGMEGQANATLVRATATDHEANLNVSGVHCNVVQNEHGSHGHFATINAQAAINEHAWNQQTDQLQKY